MTTTATVYGGFNEDQGALAEIAGRLLEGGHLDARAGSDEGWFGVGIPEALGGVGGSFADLAVIAEAVGSTVAATAVPWTAGVIAPLLMRFVTGSADWLPELAAGSLSVAVPVEDPSTVAARLTGSAATASGSFLVLGPTDGFIAMPTAPDGVPTLALVPVGSGSLALEPLSGIDTTRALSRVIVSDIDAWSAAAARGPQLFDQWRTRMAVIAALDAVGAARQALDRTVAYSLSRQQFGRVIGSFQAYKHRCASMLVELKLAQSLAHRAAREIDSNPAQALAAGLFCTTAAVGVCGEAIQLHGGIGYTWEAGLHSLLKRARLDELIGHGDMATARHLLALP